MTKLTVIQDPLPSDNFQFGGQPLNQIILYLTGTNLDAEEDIRINTMTKFYSGKLAIYSDDPLLTRKIIIKSENIDTGADKTVTFRNPTIQDDFFVTEQQNQVLYNKVLSTNTQVTANLTFSAGAILGAIISGASNTLSNIPNSALLQITDKTKLNSNIVYIDQANTYGDFIQTIRSGRLVIRNPANTFGYIITGGSITADRTLTYPTLTGNDIFTANDATQILKNKTENIDENTFKHSTTNVAGDILYYDSTATKYTRKPQGGNGTFLGVSGGVLGYYTPPDTGEVNTIASIGVGGVSIIPDNPKTGVVLNFKSMFPASTKLSIVDGTTANDRVEFDVVEANLNIANMTGSLGNARLVDLAYTKLTGVPTTFAPTAHGSSHASNGTDAIPIATTTVRGTVELATDGETAANVVVQGNDARLSNARTPLAHVHSGADITSGVVGPTFGGTGKSTFTQHALLKGGASNAYSEVPIGTEGHVLKVVSGTPAWAAETGGGGGGAPTTASYVTLGTDVTLSNERVLTAGTNIAFVDAGAGLALTLNVPDASTTVKGAVELATSAETTATLAVSASDTRLSDARTPLAHVHSGADITSGTVPIAQLPVASDTAKGIAELALSSETTAGLVVQASDTRLSDARTPLGHGSTHASNGTDPIPIATTTVRGTVELATDGETTANVVVQGNDARLSNARTPTVHKGTHTIAGATDTFVKGDDLAAAARYLEDVTDPASDAQRIWLEDTTANLKYWSDEVTPVKHVVERQANKAAASGYASLDSGTKVPVAQLPDATTTVKGVVELATDNESAANVVVQGNDARMSNARTPLAHVHSGADITSGSVGPTFGGTGKTSFTQHALLKGGASNAYSEIPVGTEGFVLKVVSGTPAWAAESGGGGGITASSTDVFTNKDINALTNTIKNIGGVSYEMWIEAGPTYKARNISTGVITSNTSAKVLLQNTLNAMSVGAGTVGGKLLIRDGIYDIDGSVQVGNATYPTNTVLIEGEVKGAVVIRSITNIAHQFDPYCNTVFKNISFDGNALATQLIACGQPVYVNVSECIFARHTDIGVWFGVLLKGFVVDRCRFEDPRGTQDQFAYTCTEFGIVTNNSFDRLSTVFTSAVTGGSCLTSGGGDNIVIMGNRFTKAVGSEQSGFGCSIEPWNRNYNNVTIANNVFQAAILRVGGGALAAWETTGTPNCLMRNIIINGNVLNGAEIGVMGPNTGFTDKVREVTVTNNIVYKSNNAGIRLNFLSGPIIANGNMIVDSNMAGAVNTLGDHGCVWILSCTDVTFNGNKIYMTATGTNVNPYGLQLSSVAAIIAEGNSFSNTTGNPSYQDLGSSTNKLIKDNYGINDDITHIRQRDLGSALIRMHGNDLAAFTLVSAEAGPSPNQGFHFFPDYNKQSGSTDATFFYGYNSDISSIKYYSKWDTGRGNKNYASFDFAANLIDLKTPIRIGDNLRIKFADTGLTAERLFSFPDVAGTLVVASQLVSERVGKSQANGGGTSFTIAHGLGALPTYVFVQLYSHNTAISYSWDATNITVTAASALPAGTNNVLMIWRVIA